MIDPKKNQKLYTATCVIWKFHYDLWDSVGEEARKRYATRDTADMLGEIGWNASVAYRYITDLVESENWPDGSKEVVK